MNYKEQLLNKQTYFLEKQRKAQAAEGSYYEMLSRVVNELIHLIERIEQLSTVSHLKAAFKPYEGQWFFIMDEICEALEVLATEAFGAIKGKKIYEEVDEVMADLDDWIEAVNEMEMDDTLPYLEAWDIGVFF